MVRQTRAGAVLSHPSHHTWRRPGRGGRGPRIDASVAVSFLLVRVDTDPLPLPSVDVPLTGRQDLLPRVGDEHFQKRLIHAVTASTCGPQKLCASGM
jgi:hypothetical protein